MFDMLVVSYLFLGGCGAGALVLLCILELHCFRRSAGYLKWGYVDNGWTLCCVTLALAIVFIAADLGRPDRLLFLVFSPKPTVLTMGAYALLAAFAVSAFFALAWKLDSVCLSSALRVVLAAAGVVFGLLSATYTGVLLQNSASVLLWQTPLLPLLFLLSSLSGGAALLMAFSSFSSGKRYRGTSSLVVSRVDTFLLVGEVLVLVAFIARGMATQGSRLAALSFVIGDNAPLFWCFVVGVGFICPAVAKMLSATVESRAGLFIAGAVLVGCFALRYCVVASGSFDATQLAAVSFGLTLR